MNTQKEDIAGWLRRRSKQDICVIPGRLAGEIADHIDKLSAIPAQPQLEPMTSGCTHEKGST